MSDDVLTDALWQRLAALLPPRDNSLRAVCPQAQIAGRDNELVTDFPWCGVVCTTAQIGETTVQEFVEGTVDGIDVLAFEGQPVLCLAFINQEGVPPEQPSIQVTTYEPRLQSALELASSKGSKAEVTYRTEGDDPQKRVLRVRLLDRG